MKVNGRRVAWIAALALAAMLAATPREGAAGPYKMIADHPRPPMLGEPDLPGGRAQRFRPDDSWQWLDWFRVWIRSVADRMASAEKDAKATGNGRRSQ